MPSVTAYSQSVSPTTAVLLFVGKTSPLPRRSGKPPSDTESHAGASPVRSCCTTTSAMLTQLSMASPRLLMVAARKWKKGEKSGVHMRSLNWAASLANPHRIVVFHGMTATSCISAFTRLCTASERFRSRSG